MTCEIFAIKEVGNMKKEIFLYPWDVLDEGAQPLARRLAALGIESVSVAVVYHSGKLLLPHNPRRHVLLHGDCRAYFPFDASRYGRLCPIPGELLEGRGAAFWDELLTAFHGEKIRVCAWVVVFHADRLARQNPDCALQDPWGEPSAHSLCPSNEEVFRYALDLLEEIAGAGVDELHLESAEYAGFLHGAHHEMQAYADTAELDRLMGLCFCPACMERAWRAGVDAGALREAVKKRAERFFNLEPPEPLDTQLWNAYGKLRTHRITQLYTVLRERLRKRGLHTQVKPILWMTDGADPRAAGVDPALLAPAIDGVLAVYPSAAENVASFTARARSMVPPGVPLTGGIRLMAPQTVRPQQVRAYIRAYEDAGVDEIIFYNYAMAPLPFLEAMAEEGTK